MRSLSGRLLASVSVLLLLFFAITVVALDLLFRDLSGRALRERLDVQLVALLAASEEASGHVLEPARQLTDVRYGNPGSGLYGQIVGAGSQVLWRSDSLTGTGLDLAEEVAPGERRLRQLDLTDGTKVLALSLGVSWEFADGVKRDFTYSVAESLAPYFAQLARFRGQLTGWFTALALALLVALWALLRRVLKPLRRIEQEIEDIEAGQRTGLGDGYPRELEGVTTNLNALLAGERERLERYRRTLGNLAHSLKTPLAVMRTLLGESRFAREPVAREFDQQIERMDEIVNHQLRRAAASAGSGLGEAPLDVDATLRPLIGALTKVHVDRGIECRLDVAPGTRFRGDRGDLMEVAGNLLDNAFKWARREVSVHARNLVDPQRRRPGLELVVDDDGPGIAEPDRSRVLERGTRLDLQTSGQGIGLSVVREIAELTGGEVVIEASSLGGTRVRVTFWPR
jgi:two-component system sensor histidine kinase PhoQ